ncbi:MAG: hypothetical protein ACOVS5_18850, partial [Oligoflexus sp.]
MTYSVLLALLLLSASDLYARWDHRNARELNRYEVLGLEFYNDLLSYRPPWMWAEIFTEAQVRYEGGAGSLNQRDLFFGQRLSVMTPRDEPWRLHYQRQQSEDARQLSDQNQLELSYTPPQSNWRLGLLSDGTTDKAYADLGWSTVWGQADASFVRLDLWWVDGFFREKKPNRNDRREGAPNSLSLLSQYRSDSIRIKSAYEKEWPIVWIQESRGTLYRSVREFTQLLIERSGDSRIYYLDWQHEWLKESLGPFPSHNITGYTVYEDGVELGIKGRHGPATSQLALWGLHKDVRYRGSNADPVQGFPSRLPGLETLERREYAAFATWRQPWTEASSHATQWGIFVNQVYLEETSREQSSEVKLQWSYDWSFSKRGRMLFGTTWDLDQLVEDFPFGTKPFRPWGGGY